MRLALFLLLLGHSFQCLQVVHAKHEKSPNHRYNQPNFIELNPNYVPNRWKVNDKFYDLSGGSSNPPKEGDFEDVYYSYLGSPLESSTSPYVEPQMGIGSLASDYMKRFPAISTTSLACVTVFISWQIPACRTILSKWFVNNRQNLRQGRWLSTLLSAVSHSGLLHIWFNLMALHSFGPSVQRALQNNSLQQWPLWPLLVGSALAGSLTFLGWNTLLSKIQPRRFRYAHHQGCMGLSGVTFALITVHALVNPTAEMRLLVAGILPVAMTARILLQVAAAWTALMLVVDPTGSSTAHAAHAGGMLFGWAYHEVWKRRYRLGWRLHEFRKKFLLR